MRFIVTIDEAHGITSVNRNAGGLERELLNRH
jgi:hypothetical protein